LKKSVLILGMLLSFGAAKADTVYDYKGVAHQTGLVAHAPIVGANRFVPSFEFLSTVPDKYDSRTENFVAPIKDQGQCGSCWDFSMTKSLESARLVAGKTYLDLAEQDPLVNDSNMDGCNGGYMDATYWVQHGLALESDCPYKADDGVKCAAKAADHGASWGFVGAEGRAPTEDELKAAIYKYKVISITVAAGGSDWDGGNGGKMTSCGMSGVNHMVNLVGYDCTANQAIPNRWWPWPRPRKGGCTFIGANSWGTDWGDKGFFYAKQGCDEMASDTDSALWISYGSN
jgi:C1A family cysteine protease